MSEKRQGGIILYFQQAIDKWLRTCMGDALTDSHRERNYRFLEEALELVQSSGLTEEEAQIMVKHVYSRPVGETYQEVGGVMVTLAAYCTAHQINMDEAGTDELLRISLKMKEIRAKQLLKPLRAG